MISSVFWQSEAGGEGSPTESSSNGVWQGEELSETPASYQSVWEYLMFLLYQQILPGVRVIIVNPETRGPLGDSHLGEVRGSCKTAALLLRTSQSRVVELKAAVSQSVLHFQIWVNSPHNASGYYTIYGEESLQANHFNTKLSFGDPLTLWARTGYLGFVKRTELLDASGGK